MEEKNIIFREEALDNLSTPDQLTDYLRVSKSRAWILVTAIIIVLAGLILWAFMGRFQLSNQGMASIVEGEATIILQDQSKNMIYNGQKAYTLTDDELYISEVIYDEYERPVGYAKTDLEDGVYEVRIVSGELSPMELLFGNTMQ